MSSDHTPVIVTLLTNIKTRNKPSTLYNFKTNWNKFRALINEKVILNILLKTPDDVDNVTEYLNTLLQESSYAITPELMLSEETKFHLPANIRELLTEKRKLRRVWHNTGYS